MTLIISIPPESEAKLKQRAAAVGQDVSAYVAQLVRHFTEPPTPLEELSGPIYQRFLESGMSDDELAAELERAKHEMRADRRAEAASDMLAGDPANAVFDCPIYAQALINPRGPAAACLAHAQSGRIALFISDYVIGEIRELPGKLKPRLGVTPDRVERLIQDLAKYARPVDNVPEVYRHPHDADDSHYVNLALATESQLILSRDRHLLDLMDQTRSESRDFARRFPMLRIVEPHVLLQELAAREQQDSAG